MELFDTVSLNNYVEGEYLQSSTSGRVPEAGGAVEFTADLSNGVMKLTPQLSGIITSVTQPSFATSMADSMRAWAHPLGLAELVSLKVSLPAETQQLENLGQQLCQALAPLAHIGAACQQIMEPLVHIS
jgi:hypothetical protein